MTDLRKAHAEHGSTSLRLAAEMALKALEWNYGTDLENIENCTAWLDKLNATIPALRQALAMQVTTQVTTQVTGDVDAVNMSQEHVDETAKGEHEPDFDVVTHALEIHREKLWRMCNSNLDWGAMDYIRMDQIAKLDKAIANLKEKNA